MLRSAVVLVVLSVAFASVVPDNGHKGCDLGDMILQPGETAPSKTECAEYTCFENGLGSGKTCPSVAAPESCKRIEHKDVILHPFPDCCPTFEC